jgi:hypothetical protein
MTTLSKSMLDLQVYHVKLNYKIEMRTSQVDCRTSSKRMCECGVSMIRNNDP